MKITTVSAREMRSYNYSHFEITLTADVETGDPIATAKQLSIECAKLVDRAIARYRSSKVHTDEQDKTAWQREAELSRLERLIALRRNGEEISPEAAALLRRHDSDPSYIAKLRGEKFDYDRFEDYYDGRGPYYPEQKVAVAP